MNVIRRHANRMHKLVNAIPPRPSCVYPASAKKPLGAWFATNPNGAETGDCINAPDVSLAFYMLYGECAAAWQHQLRAPHTMCMTQVECEVKCAVLQPGRAACCCSAQPTCQQLWLAKAPVYVEAAAETDWCRVCAAVVAPGAASASAAAQAPRATRRPPPRTCVSAPRPSHMPRRCARARCTCSPPRPSAACQDWAPTPAAAPAGPELFELSTPCELSTPLEGCERCLGSCLTGAVTVSTTQCCRVVVCLWRSPWRPCVSGVCEGFASTVVTLAPYV